MKWTNRRLWCQPSGPFVQSFYRLRLHLFGFYRLGCETWVERETVNGRTRAGLKVSRVCVLCQKLGQSFDVLEVEWIDVGSIMVARGEERHSLGPTHRARQIVSG